MSNTVGSMPPVPMAGHQPAAADPSRAPARREIDAPPLVSLSIVPGGEALVTVRLDVVGHVDEPQPARLSGRLRQVLGEMDAASHCLHDRCGPRVMDSRSLIELVGRAPAGDRLFGLYKMSAHYKAVIGALDRYNGALDGTVGDPFRVQGDAAKLKAHLKEIESAADSYIAKHQRSTAAKDRDAVDAMRVLKQHVAMERGRIDEVAETTAPVAGMKWRDAIIGANYRLLDSISRFNDSRIDPDESRERFGAGQVNTVAKLVYGPRETVFKADPKREASDAVANEMLRQIGIDRERPCYAARNVATAFVNEALGMSCAPHCAFALHNGEIGFAMDLARGKPPQARGTMEIDAETAQVYKDSGEQVEQRGERWVRVLPKVSIRQFTEGLSDGMKGRVEANLQRELTKLQWLDAICGQVDRHAENYLVDVDRETGAATVTGIDNDFSFGTRPARMSGDGLRKLPALPPIIDRATAARLDRLDFDRDLAPTLRTLVSSADPDELSAARARFNDVKARAAELVRAGMVVDDWQTWRAPPAVDVHPRTAGAVLVAAGDRRSYWARELVSQEQTAHLG